MLDLNSLQSVREFAAHFNENSEGLHLLINNAGIVWIPFDLHPHQE